MSEDTDERMERATRIRQMREGQRENTAGDDDDESHEADESSADDGTESVDADTTSADDATSTVDDTTSADDETASEGDEVVAAGEDTAEDAVRDSDATETGEPEHAGTSDEVDEAARSDADPDAEPSSVSDTDGSPTADESEADAVARRAAQAAAQMTREATDGTTSAEALAAAASAEAAQTSAADEPAVAMQGPNSVELPDQDAIRAAIENEGVDSEAGSVPGPASGRVIDAQDAATAEETIRVLEFTLGEEHYCLDIAHVEEIVKRDSITRVPNTPAYVEGVVDLRGQITTILDPKRLLDIDGEGSESLLVVFEPEAFEDQGAIGWVVDEVRQVVPVAESMITDAPVDADYVEGVIDRDDEDEFVIWTNPEVAIERAAGEHEDDDGA